MTPFAFESAPEPAPMPDDSDLLARLAQDDTVAFQALLDAYWTPLVRYIARILDGPDAAEDVVQETFVRFWERRSEWRPGSVPRAILFTISRNLALNQRESDLARLRRSRRSGLELAESHRGARTPTQELDERELNDLVFKAIDALPERRREVFMLSRFGYLTYQEIGKLLGISARTVANHMTAALSDLDRALGRYLS